MQYRAIEPGIEVNGQTVSAVTDGFQHFKSLAKKFLLREGIGQDEHGELLIDAEGWYSQEAWLRAFQSIGEEVGDSLLFDIGLAIPRNAKFPPWVVDIESAVRSVDIAYHMNHRRRGKVMFDPETGKLAEGIGHYGFDKVEGRQMIVSICDNPYPCSFDRGILTTMARKFEPSAVVAHNDAKPCRKSGGTSCTYIVTWR